MKKSFLFLMSFALTLVVLGQSKINYAKEISLTNVSVNQLISLHSPQSTYTDKEALMQIQVDQKISYVEVGLSKNNVNGSVIMAFDNNNRLVYAGTSSKALATEILRPDCRLQGPYDLCV